MIVNTKYYGEIEMEDDRIITFPKGILGLEEYKKYILFEMPDNPKLFLLQSMDEESICFLLIKPWDFFPDYETEISDEELSDIHVNSMEQLAVFNIINIKEEVSKSTANLLAPIIINADTREALQIVLQEDKYKTKHFIFSQKEGD
ncbi:MAG: flagellar assembly protein FliW [Clostridiales bacterium]|nr:flagellar assembly protein FliW [Clostridiales bacterium]